MEIRLLVEVLAGVAQVERHLRRARAPGARVRRLARKPLGRRRRLLVPKRTVRPLPGHPAVGLREPSGGVQVVAVHRIAAAIDDGCYGHGAAGCG